MTPTDYSVFLETSVYIRSLCVCSGLSCCLLYSTKYNTAGTVVKYLCLSPLSFPLSFPLSIFPFSLICNKKLRVREMESFKREKVKERWRKGEREGKL